METIRKGIDAIGLTVAFACHDGQGNYLLAKRGVNCRDEHGTWDFGSGGVEIGDSIVDTLTKEIKEEYCADVIEHQFLGYRDIFREQNGVKTHWLALEFKVRIDREQARNGEPHKLEEIGWFALDELPFPLHSQLPAFIEQNREILGVV